MEKLRAFCLSVCLALTSVGVLTPTTAVAELPTSPLSQDVGKGKYTEAINLTIKKGGNIAITVIMVVGFLVFSASIIYAFWKMRKGEFELADLGTVAVTAAVSAGLVLYALNEAKSVLGTT